MIDDKMLTAEFQQVLDAAVESGEECGCQLTVYRHGKLVCELFSGWTTQDHFRKVDAQTLFPIFSVGKGVATTLIHILAEQDRLDYDAPVIRYWPEYGVNGKAGTTVRDILSHRAGLYDYPAGYPFEDWFNWSRVVPLLANMAPLDKIGGIHHYHAHTYGVLTGHLAECVTGRNLRELFESEIFTPLGIRRMFFGMPESCRNNLAPIDGRGLPPDFRTDFNRQAVLGGLNPSSNGVCNATSLARIYAALLPGGIDGVQLLKEETINQATVLCRAPEDTLDLSRWDKFGLGYALCGPAEDLGRMFGHGGACGAEGFADRKTGYAVGFTKNRLNTTHPVHPTRDAISRVLGIPERVW